MECLAARSIPEVATAPGGVSTAVAALRSFVLPPLHCSRPRSDVETVPSPEQSLVACSNPVHGHQHDDRPRRMVPRSVGVPFKLAVLVWLVAWLRTQGVAVGAVSLGELTALSDFRVAMGSPSSLANWATGDPCANGWTGVSCSTSPVAVTCVLAGLWDL